MTDAPLPPTFFEPRRIAVVGASERPGPASSLLRTLMAGGFTGEIVPVNPNRDSVLGLPAVASLADAPPGVDLAIVMVRPELVPGVVREAAAARVRTLMIYTAGFAEMGSDGAAVQRAMAADAAAAGVRLLGPNCLGFVSTRSHTAAMVMPPESLPAGLRAGGAAIVSQSGGLMISAMEYGARIGLGTGLIASTGNEADITTLDLLEAAVADSETTCVGLIAEGMADGRRFLRIASEAGARGVRIAALKLGRSDRGAAAVRTHTAALAGSARVFDAACREAGVTVVHSIADLVDHLALFERSRPGVPSGDLAVLTISGGTKILVADLAERYGVPLAVIKDATIERLRSIIPDIGVGDNPLDITAAAIEDASVVTRSVEALAADPGVGVIALVMHLRHGGGSPSHQRLVRAFTAMDRPDGPQLAVMSSIPEGLGGFWRSDIESGTVPFLNGLDGLRAIGALRAAPSGGTWAREASATHPGPPPAIAAARTAGRAMVGEVGCHALLRDAGIPVPRAAVARTRDEAMRHATEIGYPVVLKVVEPELAHRAAMGGVRIGLASEVEVATAWDGIAAALGERVGGAALQAVLVQEMRAPIAELLVGVTVDAQFGPVLTVGVGGVFAETLDDTATRLAPVDAAAAEAMLLSLRAFDHWSRHDRAVGESLGALADAVARISRLGAGLVPWIDAFEVNPLALTAGGPVALDGLATLKPAGGAP